MFTPPLGGRRMPVLSQGGLTIDYSDEGQGLPVVLIHSSVSGNRQWRSLTEALSDRYRVRRAQPLRLRRDHALAGRDAAVALRAGPARPGRLRRGSAIPSISSGIRYGGTVALKAATLLGSRVGSLVLLEPNPVYLLEQAGRMEAFLEMRALRDHVKTFGALGDWAARRRALRRLLDRRRRLERDAREAPRGLRRGPAAELPRVGHGDGREDHGRATGRARVPDARHERSLDAAPDPRDRRDPRAGCPHWSFRAIAEGGHMAPLTRPSSSIRSCASSSTQAEPTARSAAARRRSASAAGSGRRARRPCRPRPASGS